MGAIYFVRHAESDFRVHDDFLRPLTEKGVEDSLLVTNYLKDKDISYIYSSPYIRAVDTVKELADEECLKEVQFRNVTVLMELVQSHPEANCVIGSHGTALSTIINHFNPHFGFEGFSKIKALIPWIVKFTFEYENFIKMEFIDVFKNNEITPIHFGKPLVNK